jgi:hypothetical protein
MLTLEKPSASSTEKTLFKVQAEGGRAAFDKGVVEYIRNVPLCAYKLSLTDGTILFFDKSKTIERQAK